MWINQTPKAWEHRGRWSRKNVKSEESVRHAFGHGRAVASLNSSQCGSQYKVKNLKFWHAAGEKADRVLFCVLTGILFPAAMIWFIPRWLSNPMGPEGLCWLRPTLHAHYMNADKTPMHLKFQLQVGGSQCFTLSWGANGCSWWLLREWKCEAVKL